MRSFVDMSGRRACDDQGIVALAALGFFGGGPEPIDPPVNTAPPSYTGTVRYGQTVTAVPGSWTGADSVARSWRIAGVEVGTGPTLVVPDSAGNLVLIETATNAGGSTPAQSAGSPLLAPANIAAPSYTGTVRFGSTVTAVAGTWSGAASTARAWKNGAATLGAGATLAVPDQAGSLTLQETATNAAGTSAPTSSVGSPFLVPANSVAPVITGTPTIGSTLTRTTAGTWSGSASVAGQWRKNTANIAGQTGTTYVIAADTVNGNSFRYRETATNAAGSATADSNAIVAQVVTITGTAFPGETLTAAGGSGGYQWTKDGSNIGGATASTYTQGVNDIGGVMRCVRGGVISENSLTVWHPRDLPGVTSGRGAIHLANFGLLNAGAAACVDAEAVATWQDISGNGYHLTQGTAANRPLAQLAEVAGNNAVQFDGTNDGLEWGGGALGIFQNRPYGYILMAIIDSNPAGGDSSHVGAFFSTGTNAGGSRNTLYTRQTTVRRLDADGAFTAMCTPLGTYHVLTSENMWLTGGSTAVRQNGVQIASTPITGTLGNTSNTASLFASVGYLSSSSGRLPGLLAGIIVASPAAPWTATQRSQAERYLGLLVGQNIPLQ